MSIRGYRRVVAGLLVLVGVAATEPAEAQSPEGRATVEGLVYDSLGHAPLVGATVNLVAADSRAATYGAVSDSAGHYVVRGVEPGTYVAGFFHPLLDSIGIRSPLRRVTVSSSTAGGPTRIDLAVPSGERIREAICKPRGPKDSTGVFVGHVQDATTNNAVGGATVMAEWLVINVVGGRVAPAIRRVSATSNSSGWFAFCGLPGNMMIAFVAASGADSSGQVNLDVPARYITHRDLYVGPAERITSNPVDTASTADSLRVPTQVLYRGPARLRGIVHDAASHVPLPGVQVTVVGTGLTTMANDRGEFTLTQLPLGTQTMVARKVGYLPTERLVDFFPHDTDHVDIELPTIKSVLDTVRVTASRVYNSDRNGFYRRQRTGFGHYYDATQIARIGPFETSTLVTRVPGVRVTQSGLDRTILVRSGMGYCSPDIFIDGIFQKRMTFDELDMIVHPDQIEGMEVYTSPTGMPPEFIRGYESCGVVAVWTQRRKPRVREP